MTVFCRVSVIAYYWGYFLRTDLKEIIRNGYCPCEDTIPVKIELTLFNDLLFSKLEIVDSTYAKSLNID